MALAIWPDKDPDQLITFFNLLGADEIISLAPKKEETSADVRAIADFSLGVSLIFEERMNNIQKGFDVKHDRKHNPPDTLTCAAAALLCRDFNMWPNSWKTTVGQRLYENIIHKKTRAEQLAVVGAWVAAEIDAYHANVRGD
jgi:hypothetical protein